MEKQKLTNKQTNNAADLPPSQPTNLSSYQSAKAVLGDLDLPGAAHQHLERAWQRQASQALFSTPCGLSMLTRSTMLSSYT